LTIFVADIDCSQELSLRIALIPERKEEKKSGVKIGQKKLHTSS
jgi:hypothetical protein